ncbi:MAG: sugar ABC transporter permease, partial [Anaerolineaceae bacterium]|nr:sugar ABC transporter permease [Anaerolineaceae bacterium]
MRRLSSTTRKKLGRTVLAYLLLSPALLIAAVFVYYPSLYVLRLSFFDWDLISPAQTFVGSGNYLRLLAPSSDFWNSLLRTLEYCLIYIPLSLASGLLLATALTHIRRLQGFFQSVYFIPSITSISVVSVVWSYIYNPQIGPLSQFLAGLGLPPAYVPQWLNDPALALPALALAGVWQSLGFVSLLFIAGLKNIPRDYHEAAAVDGASRWTSFWKVTFPLLSPVTFFVLFMLLIDSFRV